MDLRGVNGPWLGAPTDLQWQGRGRGASRTEPAQDENGKAFQENRLPVERWPSPMGWHTLVLELYELADSRPRTSSRRNLRSRRGPMRYTLSRPRSAHLLTVLGCTLTKAAVSATVSNSSGGSFLVISKLFAPRRLKWSGVH